MNFFNLLKYNAPPISATIPPIHPNKGINATTPPTIKRTFGAVLTYRLSLYITAPNIPKIKIVNFKIFKKIVTLLIVAMVVVPVDVPIETLFMAEEINNNGPKINNIPPIRPIIPLVSANDLRSDNDVMSYFLMLVDSFLALILMVVVGMMCHYDHF